MANSIPLERTCGLALHEGNARMIEFGRFATLSSQQRGERCPETFTFILYRKGRRRPESVTPERVMG